MIPLKELRRALEELGADGITAFEAAEESVTYGTNCFEIVLSERPYAGIRFQYDQYSESVRPLILRIHIKKKEFNVPKELVESLLPALVSAEEDEEWMSIALRLPKEDDPRKLIESAMEVVKTFNLRIGGSESKIYGYVPVDCGPYLEYALKNQ
ncbi:hypothetical protein IPA_08415 [Ignicoccus pacificus DSM 13166]|uniref:Uncharacterized protein n=1 Tax=Ignicoccus pacificus DSM 13166 TaxID=940294 RepID=A0A977KBZ4_9CREN|nr:hypothetical protein IPA_08415 [Ignicoccus pacificus DSM 13166]